MLKGAVTATSTNQHLRNAALAFAVAVLPVVTVLTGIAVRASLEQQRAAHLEAGRRAAADLAHELALREYAVETLVAHAEQILDGRERAVFDVVQHLRPVPGRDGFTMVLPPGYAAAEVGSLMGEGPIPAAGSEAGGEMAMAFALSSGFRVLQSRNLEVPWVYYLSRRGFLYIYPRAPEGEFLWSHALLGRYEGQMGSARLRPEGPRMGWSGVYNDTAGKGRMTTVSRLVVHRGSLVGDVSLDVGMNLLTGLLDRHGLPDTTVHLLAANGQDMLGRGGLPGRINVATARHGASLAVGGAQVALFTVGPSGWHVAVVTPRRAMMLRALRESSVFGLMVLFLVVSVALLVSLARALRSLAAVSVRDPLTGLYNRRHFEEFAQGELAKARRTPLVVGLAILDVDHFKKFNDLYGHHAGDRALRAVADALRGSLRRASDVLFRIGGEEFAVIACVDRPEQMKMLGDKLCAAIRALDLPHSGSPSGRVTISVGATTVEAARWVDLDTAYQQADAALYRSKASGRDSTEIA